MSPIGETITQNYDEYNDYNESYGSIISHTTSHQNLILLNNSSSNSNFNNDSNNNNINEEENKKLLLKQNKSKGKIYDNIHSTSYIKLMSTNKEFRLIFISFIITHMGEWLTYIASIALIQEQKGSEEAISYLVIIRLLPKVLLSWGLGGTIADSFDRRKTMIFLDLCGTPCALLFVIAYSYNSIYLIYIATFIQQSIAGLYQPCACSIIPLVVSNDTELKKATTLIGIAWSAMAAIGSALGGFIVAAFGSKNCFLIDSVTFSLSAFLLWLIKDDDGTHFNIATTSSSYYNNNNNNNNFEMKNNKDVENNNNHNKYYCCWWEQFKNMTINGIEYLRTSCFGVLVLLKATGALSWGAADVLNVSFSSENPHEGFLFDSTQRLGILFCFMGVGCILGPIIVEPFLDMNHTYTIQLSCIVSYFMITIGYAGWYEYNNTSGNSGDGDGGIIGTFWSLCFFALIRSTGTSVLWINSGLLLQKFSPPHLLGRIMAIDYSLGLLSEALSAYCCGVLLDRLYISPNNVSLLMSFISLAFGLIWIIWYYNNHSFNKNCYEQ